MAPKTYSDDIKDEARALIASGKTLSQAGILLGIPSRTIFNWTGPSAPERYALRLCIDPATIVPKLVLRRGPKLVNVLGSYRQGRWVFSVSGQKKERVLWRVIPTLLRRLENRTTAQHNLPSYCSAQNPDYDARYNDGGMTIPRKGY